MSRNSERIYRTLTEGIVDIYVVTVRNVTIQELAEERIPNRSNEAFQKYIAACNEIIHASTRPESYEMVLNRLHQKYNKTFPQDICSKSQFASKIASCFLPPEFANALDVGAAHELCRQWFIRIVKHAGELCTPHIRSIMEGSTTPNSETYIGICRSMYIFLDIIQAESIKRLTGGISKRGEEKIDSATIESLKTELENALRDKFTFKKRVAELELQMENMRHTITTLERQLHSRASPISAPERAVPQQTPPIATQQKIERSEEESESDEEDKPEFDLTIDEPPPKLNIKSKYSVIEDIEDIQL